MSIRLGYTCRDKVSGFTGLAHSMTEFMTGNVQFGLQPPAKDGALPDPIGFDAHQLEEVVDGPIVRSIAPPADTGIRLGEKVRDIVSKFEGVATRRTTFLNGCVYYVVISEEKGKDRHCREMFLEWKQLDRVSVGVFNTIAKRAAAVVGKKPGGPNSRIPMRG